MHIYQIICFFTSFLLSIVIFICKIIHVINVDKFFVHINIESQVSKNHGIFLFPFIIRTKNKKYPLLQLYLYFLLPQNLLKNKFLMFLLQRFY